MLYVDEGEVLTGAGASAGIDTCLHLLAGRAGQHVANRIAHRIVAAPHRAGGQAQFIEAPVARAGDDAVGRACSWALGHLGDRITIDVLADLAHMSRSTFTRAFRARTGSSVAQWVSQQLVRRARDLLESTSMSVEEISAACGFGSAALLRERFQREFRTTPMGYRLAFQQAAAS